MNDDSKPASDEEIQEAHVAPSDGGKLLPSASSTISASGEECDSHRPPSQGVYLWLCCEGWMRFGPYEWLRFDDDENAIIGPDGDVVAGKTDGTWRVAGSRGAGMGFSNPTITTTREHPHMASGSHPNR